MAVTIVNGVRLFWELSGEQGEPVVLVHGSWIDHHNWDLLIPFLSPAFRVLAYDRRGHSQSERPAAPAGLGQDVADLAGLIEALGLAPAHVVGHSMGGSIALRLAAERPELIRSLVVHEPPLLDLVPAGAPGPVAPADLKAGLLAIAGLIAAGEIEEGARQFVEKVAFGPGMWDQIPPEIRQVVMFNAPTFLEETQEPDVLTLDLSTLRRYTGPALLSHSENGLPFAASIMDVLATALPQAERRFYWGADHEPEYTQPEVYAAVLTAFINAAVAEPLAMPKEKAQ